MTIIDLFLIILILSASALCIYLIFILKNLLKKVEAVSSDFHNFINKSYPVLDQLNEISRRANKIVTEAENYWDEIDNTLKKMKEKVSGFKNLNLIRDTENPAKDLIKNLKAFIKGISAFWQTFKRN
ncbi:MAG: hypothetical protein AB1432_03945 [Bacteroidota bacterium]